jgi:uncharacterized membrane protein YeiH
MNILDYLDYIGTFSFALSGALTAASKRFDIFGVIIIAFVTALGGGMIRDVLISAYPINWIANQNYLWLVLTAVFVMYLFKSKIIPWSKTFFIFDTVGLGVFTVIGLEKALQFDVGFQAAIIMGMISASFGGVIRDILTNRVPLILKREIYASASLFGGLTYVLGSKLSWNENLLTMLSIASVILIRSLAVKYHLHLPRIKNDLFTKNQ